MKFKLEFDLDNAAFDFGHGVDGRDGSEVAKVLYNTHREVQHAALSEGDGGKIRDVNGNQIGKWEVAT
jgi:hypothetical protein